GIANCREWARSALLELRDLHLRMKTRKTAAQLSEVFGEENTPIDSGEVMDKLKKDTTLIESIDDVLEYQTESDRLAGDKKIDVLTLLDKLSDELETMYGIASSASIQKGEPIPDRIYEV